MKIKIATDINNFHIQTLGVDLRMFSAIILNLIKLLIIILIVCSKLYKFTNKMYKRKPYSNV